MSNSAVIVKAATAPEISGEIMDRVDLSSDGWRIVINLPVKSHIHSIAHIVVARFIIHEHQAPRSRAVRCSRRRGAIATSRSD